MKVLVGLIALVLLVQVSGAPKKKINYDKLEDEWDEQDEKDSDEPKKGQGPKTEMAFVTIKDGVDADEVTNKYASMLVGAGIDATAYKISKDSILMTSNSIAQLVKIKKFCLMQQETVKWTHNSKDSFPGQEVGDVASNAMGGKLSPEVLQKLKDQGISLPGAPASAAEVRREKKRKREAKKKQEAKVKQAAKKAADSKGKGAQKSKMKKEL